jgi:hypothetical protein
MIEEIQIRVLENLLMRFADCRRHRQRLFDKGFLIRARGEEGLADTCGLGNDVNSSHPNELIIMIRTFSKPNTTTFF